MKILKENEKFIKKDDEQLGKSINILDGEDSLIKNGLQEKTIDELIKMAVNLKKLNYNDASKLTKNELIKKLTDDLEK